MTTPTGTMTRNDVALDLCMGERDAAHCGGCNRALPAISDRQKFELEDANTGLPYCDVCASKRHRPLRLAVALLDAVVAAYTAGDRKAADEAVQAVASGFAMLQEAAPPVAYQRPVRRQPVRPNRRGRRR